MRRTRYDTTGVIRQGKLKVSNGTQWIDAIRSFPDGPVLVTLKRVTATRSLQSNRYYWSVVVGAISEHTGYTPDETHEALKMLFLPKHLAYADDNGEVVRELVIGGSTTRLTQAEFSDYVARIKEWALTDLNVKIPDPTYE
jgi:NinB protein